MHYILYILNPHINTQNQKILRAEMNPQKKKKNSEHQSSIDDGFSHQSHLWASPDLNTTKSSFDHHISLRSNNLMLQSNNMTTSLSDLTISCSNLKISCSFVTNSNHLRSVLLHDKQQPPHEESEGEGKGEGGSVSE